MGLTVNDLPLATILIAIVGAIFAIIIARRSSWSVEKRGNVLIICGFVFLALIAVTVVLVFALPHEPC